MLLVSALENIGVDELWKKILDVAKANKNDGSFAKRRLQQSQATMERHLSRRLSAFLKKAPKYLTEYEEALQTLKSGTEPQAVAEEMILRCLRYRD